MLNTPTTLQSGGLPLEIHIGPSEEEYLEINVFGREVPTATDFWDGNWLSVEAVLLLGGFDGAFRGKVKGELRNTELLTFRAELAALYQSLSGTATLATMEEWLKIQMAGDGRGHLVLKGQLRDEPSIGNTLIFTFEFDQTFLPKILKSLDEVLMAYPVRGNP